MTAPTPALPADLEAGLRRLRLGAMRRLSPELLVTAKTQRWLPELATEGDTGPSGDGLAGVTALIVDDNATQRVVLSEFLTEWGMTVRTADSGPAALATLRTAAIQARPLALAIVDQMMPGMDGLEVNRAIWADPGLTARVVLMTGLGQERDLGAATDDGDCTVLVKPVHRDDLHRSLRAALGLQGTESGPTGTVPDSSAVIAGGAGRLLLAEDNLINQKVAVAMLSSAGYLVDTVLNGAAAVQAFASGSYDAVLMDCQMPEMNGYEATGAIRAQEVGAKHTPIIAMTAGARREDRKRCLASGMDGYLAKPVSKDALLAMVRRFVPRPTDTAAPFNSGPRLVEESPIDTALIDELRVLGEAAHQDLLGKLVDQFVEETRPQLAALRDAVDAGDAIEVRRLAHTIRSTGGQLGGRRLALACSRLENKASAGKLADGAADLAAVEADFEELCRALSKQVA